MTFEIVKKAIEVQKKKGTLDANSMMNKLDVFLLKAGYPKRSTTKSLK